MTPPGSRRRFATYARNDRWGSLFYDPSVIQELNRLLIAAVLPHQGKELDAAFANPEICRRERHPGIFGFPVTLRGIFRLPAKDLSLPVFAKGMQVVGKGSHSPKSGTARGRIGLWPACARQVLKNQVTLNEIKWIDMVY
jgi:hypothetical protein